jgi:hypothetical protein
MMVRAGMGSRVLGVIAVGFVLVASATAGAQTLSTPILTNNSNPNEVVPGTVSAASRERQSLVQLISSPAGAFTTRYASLITTDSDGAGASAGVESIASDYQIDFNVTAPGGYDLTVTTSLSGDMHLVNDGSSASADIGPVNGASTGGAVTSGTFDIADAGITAGSGGASTGISDGSVATVFGVSNGAPVAHSLHFVFTQIVTSAAGGGDEAAVRLGINSSIATETAGDYPGSPARVQDDDGHFVTVTVTSLCGNGAIDSRPSYTEDCDEGAANGTAASCCTSTCTFKTNGSSCDDGDTCTQGDACTDGTCIPTSAQVCDLCEICDPMGGCVEAPKPADACKATALTKKASLVMKDKTPDKGDRVVFKWKNGAATTAAEFGNPVSPSGPGYALCVYDADESLVFKSTAPAEGICGSKPCWKALAATGFRYKDSARTPNGADKVLLKAGLQGKAKTQFKGKGDNLEDFGLPYSVPLTVQLQSGNGGCWGATFSSNITTNSAVQFKGKGD